MAIDIDKLTNEQLENLIANYRKKKASDEVFLRALAAHARRVGNGLNFDTTLNVVQKAALERRFVSYLEIAEASGANWNKVHYSIGQHMFDLIEFCHLRGMPLLSAIVVNKPNVRTGEMEPATLKGFVAGARALGIPVTDAHAFLKEQQEKVFSWAQENIPKD